MVVIRRIEGRPEVLSVPVSITKWVEAKETQYVPQTKYVQEEVVKVHPIKTVYVTHYVTLTKHVRVRVPKPIVLTRLKVLEGQPPYGNPFEHGPRSPPPPLPKESILRVGGNASTAPAPQPRRPPLRRVIV